MNSHQIRTIEDLPGYFGLQIEYREDLPANNAGYLDPHEEPQYIAVNRNLPHCERAFTIAHELGHYVLHVGRKPRNFLPFFLKFKPMAKPCRITERYIRRYFGKEWQADLWAFEILWQIGAVVDLQEFIKLHPEKEPMFWYSFLAAVYAKIKYLIRRLFWLRQ